ncbi:MAG: HAMP domain-containing sensor histidine kinase [Negativicutes bacterium]|jgi:signal transduction histidine kinase
MRLQKKLFLSILAVTIASMLCIYLAAAFFSFKLLEANRVDELTIKAGELAALTEDYANRRIAPDVFVRMINNVDDMLETHVLVFGLSGEVMVLSERGPRFRKPPQVFNRGNRILSVMPEEVLQTVDGKKLVDEVLAGKKYQGKFFNGYYDEDMLTVAVPFYLGGKIFGGVVLFSSFAEQVRAPLTLLFFVLAAVSAMVIVFTIFISRRIAHSLTKPIKDLIDITNRFSQGDFAVAKVKSSNDEIGELSLAFSKMAEDIRRFINETNQAERMRREFIANLSHEMRTPLTIVRGYAEAIYDGTITGEQSKRSIAIMRDEAMRLERLIQDMLDLSKLQLAQYELELEKLPLAVAVKYAVDKMRDKARESELVLKFTDPSHEAVIFADYNRVIQIIIILLDNAIKFTQPGGTISVAVNEAADYVEVVISDDGCGISKEDLPFIWERFFKADKSHNRTIEGMGLGLSIAKEIVEKHQARISVSSSTAASDHGTCFTIRFKKN